MDNIQNIAPVTLIIFMTIFVIPMAIFHRLKISINKQLSVSILRMAGQLFLVGLYLNYLFTLNCPWVNILYLLLMLFIANLSILQQSGLSFRQLGKPVFLGTLLPIIFITLSLSVIFDLKTLISARYIIPLIGMLMGNILRYNIIALSRFYGEIRKRENEYIQSISLGATIPEATLPFLREAIQASVIPQIGGLATMGLVSLPGMMTGQILGGSLPMTAIKYQLLILTAIFVTGCLSTLLVIILSRRSAFDDFKCLKQSIYIK